MAGGHFAIDIIAKKIWMQDIGGQLYSKIFMISTQIVTTIRKLED
jgi:hypothetical protein